MEACCLNVFYFEGRRALYLTLFKESENKWCNDFSIEYIITIGNNSIIIVATKVLEEKPRQPKLKIRKKDA